MLEVCPICYENEVNLSTKCKHSFCNNCLTRWKEKNSNCPYCRSQLGFVIKPYINNAFEIHVEYVYLSQEERDMLFNGM